MYKRLVENLSYGIVILDQDMRVQYANRYIEEIMKNSCSDNDYRGEICGNAFSCIKTLGDDINCGETEDCSRCSLRQKLLSIRDGKHDSEQGAEIFTLIRTDGETVRFKLKGYKMYFTGKQYLVIEIQNAEKEESLIMLSEKMGMWNQKLERVLDNLQDQVCVVDENLNYLYANNALLRAVGKRKEEVIGKSDYELVPPEMAELCRQNSRYALENGDFSSEEYTDGKWYHTLKGKVEIARGKYGVFGIIKNITEERKREHNYQKRIYTDSLTELYNRNFYEERADEIFMDSEREEDDFSIIIIDIDNFKIINDNHGHHFGDRVLQELSKIIKRNIRKKDYAVRVGGDEIILLLNATSSIAGQIGKRLIQEVNELELEGLKITISVGIATKKEEISNLRELYIRADKALYKSKKQGKNTLSYYS
ncbi:MAG: sensor domain-containing diguanylate cyclase [Fusobacteriaceae bacterium]